MSSPFLSSRYARMVPYRLGAQPKDRPYIKLNSNETTMPPSPRVIEAIRADAALPDLGHYSDQDATVLRQAIADFYDLRPAQVFCGNGADEILSFCFQAYCDEQTGMCCPDITYGFYKTYARAYGVPLREIPLDADYRVNPADYFAAGCTIVIANPNAPTGQRLSLSQIEAILQHNPRNIVIIDEAYVDFESPSCIPLLDRYPNLIVVHTMSKSRNIAGLHVGYAVGSEELMGELNCLKNCFNPNNLNQVTLDAAVAAVRDRAHMQACCAEKVRVRKLTALALEGMGFYIMPSYTNFLFVSHPRCRAAQLHERLAEAGVLTRYYNAPRIDNFLRITIGTQQEMHVALRALRNIVQAAVA